MLKAAVLQASLAVQAAAARILSGQSRIAAVVGADMTASALPGETLRFLYGHSSMR